MNKRGQSSIFFRVVFWFFDLLFILLALATSYAIRFGFSKFAFDVPVYRNLAILIILLQLLVTLAIQSYSTILSRGLWKEFKAVLKHSIFMLCGIVVFEFAIQKSDIYSRFTILFFVALCPIYMFVERQIIKFAIRKFSLNSKNKTSVLIVTTYASAPEILNEVTKDQDVRVCGVVDLSNIANNGDRVNSVPIVANRDNALEYIRTHWVDEVFIYEPTNNKIKLNNDFFEACCEMGVTVHLSINEIDSYSFNETYAQRLYGKMVISGSYTVYKPFQMFVKRILDIAGAIVGLVLTGFLFIFVAPMIYIQSPGPIFFSQERVGKNGKTFKIYKFRTMYPDAEQRKAELMRENKMDGLMFKMDDDPRIFPIGKFLRKTSIDETPQFWNVLLGSLSLVGTRPPTKDEYDQYDFHHKARLAMKPGITGMWQVSGRSNITDFEEVVRLDRSYIEKWSIGLDIKILLKTVLVVLKGEGSE